MQCWGLTDIGCVRKMNQDAFEIRQLDRNTALCVVCDGMGGAKSGNVASSLAADVFSQEIQRTWTPSMEWDKADQMLKNAVKLANFTVYDQSKQFEEFSGMGTTLVAALVRGKQVSVVNVGDSRAYLINQRGIRQITRAVGTEMTVLCDIFRQEAAKGDFLLLCSDGLSNLLDDQEVLFEVVHGVNKGRCCQRLLDIAISRGSPDNVTAVLISL